MKKIISLALCVLLISAVLCGCGKTAQKSKKTSIVVTTFPQYDWIMNILGDKASSADVSVLISDGVDLHSFQPSAADIVKISNCDLFVYIGGVSDEWVGDAVKTASNKKMIAINLLETLGDTAKEEELKEGMEAEEEEESEDIEYDEHVWLSLSNAEKFCIKIKDALCKINPENSETYEENLKAYTEKLNELDEKYKEAAENATQKTLLFGDRFPFRYLVDDYGLDYYAAFVGCSAETEASFETVSFLSKKVDELGIKVVLTIEGNNKKIAETIVNNTKSKDAKILSVNSIQAVTSKEIKNGASYLSFMEENLEVLKEALK